MEWKKKELIYSPPYDKSWRHSSALTPTPFLLNEKTIRVYTSFRDLQGVGRIGYVDLDSYNPKKILKISPSPILDIGPDGMFDDNGMILGDIISIKDKIYMYYVGFQLVEKAKFTAYSGLAISEDYGESFQRYQNTPILDRNDEALYIRAIHSVIYEDATFKFYYATGNGWETINDATYPQYDINYIKSKDGKKFVGKGQKCIVNNKQNLEYRIGRPRVYKKDKEYTMFFTYGTTDGRYIAGKAKSKNGIDWIRNDNELGINLSVSGWDSIHLCYPTILTVHNKTYMFYNGNNMGVDGFGYAELN